MTTRTTLAGALRAAVEALERIALSIDADVEFVFDGRARAVAHETLVRIAAIKAAVPPDDEALVERVAEAMWVRTHCGNWPSDAENSTAGLYRSDARAAIAAMPPPQDGWRPIESAPRDGTHIVLAKYVGHFDHPTALWWMVLGHWSAKWSNWNDGIEPSGLAGPTHWMPLPPPPASEPAPEGRDG